jgi:hypothetical protein
MHDELWTDVTALQREVKRLREMIATDRKHIADLEATVAWLAEREYDRANNMRCAAPAPVRLTRINRTIRP